MYNNVRGIGVINETNSKYIHTIYKTYNILIIANKNRFFQGNSFLYLYEAINNSIK